MNFLYMPASTTRRCLLREYLSSECVQCIRAGIIARVRYCPLFRRCFFFSRNIDTDVESILLPWWAVKFYFITMGT